jgi:RNA polymerase sigma factor (sigma-70 family)
MFIPWLFKEKSIDDFVDREGETRLSTLLADEDSINQEDSLYQKELVRILRQALVTLPDRERIILWRRFGISGEDEMTLEEIGKILGLSRERVRQLERDAKIKLRELLSERKRELCYSIT